MGIYTGNHKPRFSVSDVCRGVLPGLPWCFLREACSMGGGLALQPWVTRRLQAGLREYAIDPPEWLLRFFAGLATGACTGLATQWLHNTTLVAGRMYAAGDACEAPHYTLSSLRALSQEQGFRLFYMNYHQRVAVIAMGVAFLSTCDIFH